MAINFSVYKTTDEIAALSVADIRSATSADIKTLSTAQIKALSPEQIAAIGSDGSGGYDSSVIVALSAGQLAAF
ncbi:MAG: hypothetical protein RI959_2196, partial [Pseudomonadota bacterium]